ncbi:TniQ family protein [Arthrobacter sp. StoSoilB5]|uniref:TniQ family protein n=1 Tax=Arthrobacter sp. StoSoilB5 TaxID=2830992 RepID=UPI0021E1280C|nr:TniQ family protein [Arthrobacter sp. StoSoilB5]
MSSWLARLSGCYSMSLRRLLDSAMEGVEVPEDDLDLSPSPALLRTLTQRTGVSPETLNRMSLIGWTPWLTDSLEAEPAAFNTYVGQFSVLLARGGRPPRTVADWRAWIPSNPLSRACPQCLDDPSLQGLLLAWKLPLMLSCPEHGCFLEPCIGVRGNFVILAPTDSRHGNSGALVRAMDRLTWQALTTGYVELPRRAVHAGVWFRLLRTIIDELSGPLSEWGVQAAGLERLWGECDLPLRGGLPRWQPFEDAPWEQQANLLMGVAQAVDALMSGHMAGRGTSAHLFLPEPEHPIGDGTPPRPTVLRDAVAKLDRITAAALGNPKTAQALFDLAASAVLRNRSL